MTRARLLLLLILSVLLSVLLFGVPLYGFKVLEALPGDYDVQARRIAGPLWRPVLRDATITGPGLHVEAEELQLNVGSLNPVTRKLSLSGKLRNAEVNVNLKQVLSGNKRSNWQVLPRDFELSNVRVNLDADGYNLPDARLSARGSDGRLNIRATTRHGSAEADIEYATVAGKLRGAADIKLDAALLNQYWNGVRDGTLSGRYEFGDGPLRGQLSVAGGRLVVPQTPWVEVHDINGTVRHQGDRIDAQLQGRGWNGPVNAQATADLDRMHWQASATATPDAGALAAALGTQGHGKLQVTVEAGGWADPLVTAHAEGSGEFAGVPFEGASAKYTLREGVSRLQADSVTKLLRDRQRVNVDWVVGQRGVAAITGTLLDAPLDLRGKITGDQLRVSGQALNGPIRANYALTSRELTAQVDVRSANVALRASVQGKPDDLTVQVQRLSAGSLDLRGQGRLNDAGAKLDLGQLHLDLNRAWRGTWSADNLRAYGVTANGAGSIDLRAGGVKGQLRAAAAPLRDALEGPFDINWQAQRGSWNFGRGEATWRKDAATITLSDLDIAGIVTRGNLTYRNGQLHGRVRGTNDTGSVALNALGEKVQLSGRIHDVEVNGQTQLKPGYPTVLRAMDANLSADVRYDGALAFSLKSAGEQLRGRYANGKLSASGALDLAVMRHWVGQPDLSGRLSVNAPDGNGTAQLRAQAAGLDLQGQFKLTGDAVRGNLIADSNEARLKLAGTLYPSVDTTGTLRWRDQQLALRLQGPYGELAWAANGTTAPLSVAGVALPAQDLQATGNLTPNLRGTGRWGELRLGLRDGRVSATGTQSLRAYGQTGQVSLDASLDQQWQGELSAQANLGEYTLRLNGPWRDVRARLGGPDLQGSARIDLPGAAYDARLRGQLRGQLGGLHVDARVNGARDSFRASGRLRDEQGGRADVQAGSTTEWRAQLDDLHVAGLRLNGHVASEQGRLDGMVKAGGLTLQARDGQLHLSGEEAGVSVQGAAKVQLPDGVRDVQLNARGEWGSVALSGDLAALRGTLKLAGQQVALADTTVKLDALSLPVQASLTPVKVSVGGLTYAGGTFRGSQGAAYQFGNENGGLELRGNGEVLSLAARGPLTGDVRLLPRVEGELRVALAPLTRALPADVQRELQPGQLRARIDNRTANLDLIGARYLDDPLTLSAEASWRDGVHVSGTLQHPGTRLPFEVGTRGLRVPNAELDARALRPILRASGTISGTVNLPNFDPQQGNADLRVNLHDGSQRAKGQVQLRAGQWRAEISSDLAGRPLRIRGALYPQADADLRFGDVQGTLRGDLERGILLAASGTFEQRPVQVQGNLSHTDLNVTAVVADARLNVTAQREAGEWRGQAQVNAADLRALTGQRGHVTATVTGTPHHAQGMIAGRIAGNSIAAPVLWRDGQLRLDEARVTAPFGAVVASGPVYPALNLNGRAVLDAHLPGDFDVTVRGSPAQPDVRALGTLRAAPPNPDALTINAPGVQVDARLLGQAWRVSTQGAVTGTARGALGSGLHSASFTLAASAAWSDGRITLTGNPGWNARDGWSGTLRAQGTTFGEAADLTLRGQGKLAFRGAIGQGQVEGHLPATLKRADGGQVTLKAFDLGALWGRAGQLRFSGTARAQGQWAAPMIGVTGRLNDTGGDLTGALQGQYNNGQFEADFKGDAGKVNATVSSRNGTYRAQISAQQVAVARLLPRSWQVNRLRFTGHVTASGNAGRIESLTADKVQLQALSGHLGEVTARGAARYTPTAFESNLAVNALGGELTARGELPSGVRVHARNLNLTRWALGQVNGEVELRGALNNPVLSGELRSARADAVTTVTLGGRALDPRAQFNANLRGPLAGRFTGEVSDVRLSPLSARVRLQGRAARGQDHLAVDVRGSWPRLIGEARAQLDALPEAVTLKGDGAGRYTVNAGTLGGGHFTLEGFVPHVNGEFRGEPLTLVGASGQGSLSVSAMGPLTAMQIAVSGHFRDVARSGVRLEDLTIAGGGTLQDLAVQLKQGDREVGRYDRRRFTLQNLQAEAYGSRLRASGALAPGGGLKGTITASGEIDGKAQFTYTSDAASAHLDFERGAVRARVDAAGSRALGWAGRGHVSGLPEQVVTRDLNVKLSGPWRAPKLDGDLGLLGATARLAVDANGATLALANGPTSRGSGTLRLQGQQLSGGVALTRDSTRASLGVSGTLSAPRAELDASVNGWQARGQLTRDNGNISVSDGQRDGSLRFDGTTVRLNLPGLDLAKLQLANLQGTLTATSTYHVRSLEGSANLNIKDARTPYHVPVVDVPVRGSVNVTATMAGPRATVAASLVNATSRLNVNAARNPTWSGRATIDVRRDDGILSGNVRLDARLLNGTLRAENYPLKWEELNGRVNGTVALHDNTFDLNTTVTSNAGRVTVRGDGDLATAITDNAPKLPFDLKPGDGAYRVDVGLDSADLASLKVAPHLTGRLSGNAVLSDGGSTFVLRSESLRVAGEALPARLEGTSYGLDWRVRGFVGESQLFGSVTNGVLSGRAQLASLPVGALLGAYSGPLPGQGVVSGLARLEVPLADPLAGQVDVVAERIRVSSQNEVLTGSGSLTYSARELRRVNIQLRGAGEWNVQGEYTRARVNLTARLHDTSFTPILSIIPGIRHAKPTLSGDVDAAVRGTYEQPEATLTARQLNGTAGDVKFNVAQLKLALRGGDISGDATLSTTGAAAATGALSVNGRYRDGQLRDARVKYDGDFVTRATGRLERVTGEVLQTADGWNLDASVRQGGVARITGTLKPKLNLQVSASGLTPQLGLIHARESNLDAKLSVTERGSDYVVDGGVTFNRLLIGRVSTPKGTPGNAAKPNAEREEKFTSILPAELVTFPPPPGEPRQGNPFLSRIVLNDIPVLLPSGVRVDESVARAELAGKLTLSGRASAPKVSGQVQAVRGTLFLRENEFAITQGRAVFDGSSAYPVFSAVATGVVPGDGAAVGVAVNVSGSFTANETGEPELNLETRFSCTQNCTRDGRELTESDLYALVAFGSADAAKLPSELTQSALRTTLNVFLIGELERGIGKALGLDVFRIRTNLLSGDSDFKVEFTLGSYLSRDLYLQYRVDLSGRGLVNATYTTPDNRFTFTASSPLQGFDVTTLQPSLSVGYNLTARSSLQLGVETGSSTTFKAGYTLKF